jgi:hypothetical protein
MTDGKKKVVNTFTITVHNVNDKPVFTSSPSTAVKEDVSLFYTLAIRMLTRR